MKYTKRALTRLEMSAEYNTTSAYTLLFSLYFKLVNTFKNTKYAAFTLLFSLYIKFMNSVKKTKNASTVFGMHPTQHKTLIFSAA
jgi:hypothetical protein